MAKRRPRTAPLQGKLDRGFSHVPSQRAQRIVELRLDEVALSPDQPRKRIDEGSLQGLAASIERHGLLQPITVKRVKDGREEGYLLVAGERRYRAHRLLRRELINAIVTDGNPDEISLIENMQREDLTPFEEAEALVRIMERYGYTQGEVGQIIGKKQNTVSALLRLNTLPTRIKEEYPMSDTVSKSVLIEIARLESEDEQLRLWEEAKRGGTVRAVRARMQGGNGVRTSPSPFARTLTLGRRFVRRVEELPRRAIVANREQFEELLALRARLDGLIEAWLAERDASDHEDYRTSDTARPAPEGT
jgi:ParB family chromosome partitioning protein